MNKNFRSKIVLFCVVVAIFAFFIVTFYTSEEIGSILEYSALEACAYRNDQIQNKGYNIIKDCEGYSLIKISCGSDDFVFLLLDSKYKPYVKIFGSCDYIIDKKIIEEVKKIDGVNQHVVDYFEHHREARTRASP